MRRSIDLGQVGVTSLCPFLNETEDNVLAMLRYPQYSRAALSRHDAGWGAWP